MNQPMNSDHFSIHFRCSIIYNLYVRRIDQLVDRLTRSLSDAIPTQQYAEINQTLFQKLMDDTR